MIDDELQEIEEIFVRLCVSETKHMSLPANDTARIREWGQRLPVDKGPKPLTKNCYDIKT